uniref:TNF family profile domain-containing protein n=1 Tax=Accipiter nisus TaxID=211598 RepID=A0A8B9M085_9AVES
MLSPVKKNPKQTQRQVLMLPASPQKFALFLSYIFLPFLQSVHIKQPISKKTFVLMGSSLLSSIPGESIKGAAVNLTAEVGSIQVRNGSIMITCDGLYLLSLKGIIILPDSEKDLLKLTLWKTDKMTSTALWEQPVWVSGNAVNLTIVLYLFSEDNITLGTTKESHLSLAHIQRNPGFLYLLDSIRI